jgi:hypothetical protein
VNFRRQILVVWAVPFLVCLLALGAGAGSASASAPSNDNLANPTVIVAAGGVVGPEDTTGATIEPSERLHAGDEGGSSVWFSWTPGFGGTAQIDTVGSNFDTLLDVSALGTPNGVLASNDDASTTVNTSRICFPIDAGVTYLIAADGYAGAVGNLTLHVSQLNAADGPCPETPPTIDPVVPAVGASVNGHAGTFNGGGTQSFQWDRCIELVCESITGATATAYTPTSADVGWALRLEERRNDSVTDVEAANLSDPSEVVTQAPVAHANGRLVFASDAGLGTGTSNFEIYSALPDGSGLLRLTNRAGFDSEPMPSPDGTRIAFVRDGDIAVMNADGSGVIDLGAPGEFPAWSPDGSRIAYIETSGLVMGDAIRVMRADGTHDFAIADFAPGSVYVFDWSPDGSTLTLSVLYNGHWHIATMSADGRGPVLVLDAAATIDHYAPAWSPDGTKIAYAEGEFVGGITHGDIRMMNADGTNDHLVHNGSGSAPFDAYPDWSPDGTTLVFSRGNSTSWTIPSNAVNGTATPYTVLGAFPTIPRWAASVPPAGGGGGGGAGGGGGGGTSVPDLKVSLSASKSTLAPGEESDLVATVTNGGGAGSLQTHLVITLPNTMTLLGPPAYDRGSGCTGTQTIDCYLDYVPNGGTAKVLFAVRVSGGGTQSLSAVASADRDANLADNTSSITLTVTTTTTTTPPPPLPNPVLAQLPSRVLQAVTKGNTASVAARFSTNEPLHLNMSVTPYGSTRLLRLLKGTRLAGATTTAARLTLTASTPRAGPYSLSILLARSGLVRGKTYVIRIAARNADGKTATLKIRFRA